MKLYRAVSGLKGVHQTKLPHILTSKALQILPLTPKFLLLHPITTLKLSASPFLPPEKICGRRSALRKILTGTQPYPKHAASSWVTDLCQTHAQPDITSGEAPQILSCPWLAVGWAQCPTLPSHHNSILQKLIKNSGADTCSQLGSAGNSCLREEGCQTSVLFALPQVSANAFSHTKPNGNSAKEAAIGDLGCRITSTYEPSRSL